ncbi:MAG: hypothetical protein R3309_04145 [Reinekea sp.]|nr:hypothetical protein [Reinekea sp.]
MYFRVLIVALLLSGCNKDDSQQLLEPAPKQQTRHDFTPLSPLHAAPYAVEAIDEPDYLEPIFIGMTESYVYVDNATVFSEIAEIKALSGYEIEPVITYRYRVKMDIELDNELCVSTWLYRGQRELWSDANVDCDMNYQLYSYDEAMSFYGDWNVKKGSNFTVTFRRVGDIEVGWFIR